MTTLVLVLGDQLSPTVAALRAANRTDAVVLIAEVAAEAGYVRHHKKKLAFVFAAMRHHAAALTADGWRVDYVRLDDPENRDSLTAEASRAGARHRATRVLATHAGEWRVADAVERWAADAGVPVEILEDDRFICPRARFDAWAAGRKQLRLETFYREMRRETGLLMNGDRPIGGRWNFDADNRKPAAGGPRFPHPPRCDPDPVTDQVLALVENRFADHPGALHPFWFPVTRDQAGRAADHFFAHTLAHFGDFQDAMLRGEPFLAHSVLSIALNVGLLDPLDLCRRAEAAYHAGTAPLNAVEGFIRQILGWREFVRGLYWRDMPGYRDRNALGATRPLPDFYWTADTDMACVREVVGQTMAEAYAHHIQRLMVTGTFALLAGIDPIAVHEWYLAVYADAYEWVELPNTLGMSQFADGGVVASKPYAASGAYINRMSDYCRSCAYDVRARTGPRACPFNPLYWDFLVRHRGRLARNPRLGPVYRTWDRMAEDSRAAALAAAAALLARLDGGGRV